MNDVKKFESRAAQDENLPEVSLGNSPSAMIELAISKGADLDKLEKLMTLQERFEENEAKKAYVRAMAEFKKDPPEIIKDKTAEFDHSSGGGKTKYSYADLSMVSAAINQGLSEHGLSASWQTSQAENTISVTCKITHEFGHSETTTLSAAPDTSGKKNAIQAIGSTISYLEKYTLLAATGIAAKGMDNDGQGDIEYVNEKQVSSITDMLNETNADHAKFLKAIGVESIEKIPSESYKKVISIIRENQKKKEQPA